jgi:hypothetical protein
MRNALQRTAAVIAAAGIVSMICAAEPRTIKEVMKEAHDGGPDSLLAKVAGGKGDKEDAEKLLALYKDLAANKPSRGDEKVWKKKTDAILAAAEGVVKGEAGANAKLVKAANCMSCHSSFKPKK